MRKLDHENPKTLFEQLRQRKHQGEFLRIEDLSRDEIFQLWHYESGTDREIAELFDISANKVKKLRQKLKITITTLAMESALADYLSSNYAKEICENEHQEEDEKKIKTP